MTTEATEALERVPDDFMQRPYEILEKYRNAGPVHHVVFPHGADVWLVTGTTTSARCSRTRGSARTAAG
jgi:hypothetical protein